MSQKNKIIVLLISLIAIVGIPTGVLWGLDQAYKNSFEQVEARAEKEKLEKEKNKEVELTKKIEEENKKFGFATLLKDGIPDEKYGSYQPKTFAVDWKTNFGDIKLNLNSTDAPKTVESFVRVMDRKSIENSGIHRIVIQPNFAVIQGGDFDKKNGQGGQSGFYLSEQKPNNIPDELWAIKPTINNDTGQTDGGKFINPELYAGFNTATGSVEYQKGLILMAKTSQPDSASSQFFVTLDKTILPAQYTVFGTVDKSSLGTLDKIKSEVKPVKVVAETEDPENQEATKIEEVTDGKPSKEIKIEKTEVKIV
jgi:cyclophilin family peptidyl-prolyl cis-trans isomerase